MDDTNSSKQPVPGVDEMERSTPAARPVIDVVGRLQWIEDCMTMIQSARKNFEERTTKR